MIDEDPLVTVSRAPGDYQTAQYRMSDIANLHWSHLTGGVHRFLSRPRVMGYVWCNEMETGEVVHSCRHGSRPHEIKVCVLRTHNRKLWKTIQAPRQAGQRVNRTRAIMGNVRRHVPPHAVLCSASVHGQTGRKQAQTRSYGAG